MIKADSSFFKKGNVSNWSNVSSLPGSNIPYTINQGWSATSVDLNGDGYTDILFDHGPYHANYSIYLNFDWQWSFVVDAVGFGAPLTNTTGPGATWAWGDW